MPINRRSIQMLGATGTDMNKYSEAVKGDSYYGYTDGLHTLQVSYNEYVGRFRIQATLSLNPGAGDWFDIIPEASIGATWNSSGYIQFNANDPATGSDAYTFRGNFAYVRVYMDREHVGDGATYDSSYGQISRVILSS